MTGTDSRDRVRGEGWPHAVVLTPTLSVGPAGPHPEFVKCVNTVDDALAQIRQRKMARVPNLTVAGAVLAKFGLTEDQMANRLRVGLASETRPPWLEGDFLDGLAQ